jgi:hypothetical protein
VLDLVEFEEVYFLHIVWNLIGPCSLQSRITSGSNQDCSDYGFRTTYISQTVEGNFVGEISIFDTLVQWELTD